MLIVLDPVLSEGINLFSRLLHLCEVGTDVVFARLYGLILNLPLFGSVINDQLGLHDLKRHHE